MREIYIFDCENAEKACESFSKIPIDYYSYDLLKEYIDSLKLCYRFEDFRVLSKQILEHEQCFEIRYLFLRELSDSALVADGAITAEEYFEYKSCLLELLKGEIQKVKSIIP